MAVAPHESNRVPECNLNHFFVSTYNELHLKAEKRDKNGESGIEANFSVSPKRKVESWHQNTRLNGHPLFDTVLVQASPCEGGHVQMAHYIISTPNAGVIMATASTEYADFGAFALHRAGSVDGAGEYGLETVTFDEQRQNLEYDAWTQWGERIVRPHITDGGVELDMYWEFVLYENDDPQEEPWGRVPLMHSFSFPNPPDLLFPHSWPKAYLDEKIQQRPTQLGPTPESARFAQELSQLLDDLHIGSSVTHLHNLTDLNAIAEIRERMQREKDERDNWEPA